MSRHPALSFGVLFLKDFFLRQFWSTHPVCDLGSLETDHRDHRAAPKGWQNPSSAFSTMRRAAL